MLKGKSTRTKISWLSFPTFLKKDTDSITLAAYAGLSNITHLKTKACRDVNADVLKKL